MEEFRGKIIISLKLGRIGLYHNTQLSSFRIVAIGANSEVTT